MNEKNKSQYHIVSQKEENEIEGIINGKYENVVFGTIDTNNFPFLSKIIPMNYKDNLYLLLSDLSEHTKNIKTNKNSSIYFSAKETHQQKLNNPRLTLTGKIKKLNITKNSQMFSELLKNYSNIEKGAKFWGKFDDFNFYRFEIIKYTYIKGFGKAYIREL